MKANEAPEKIYIALDEIDDLALDQRFDYPICTEYTRTDAFIKKACEFINKANLYLYHCISEECDLVDTDKMIEEFKNYMKRE